MEASKWFDSSKMPQTGNEALDDEHVEICEMYGKIVVAYQDENGRESLRSMLALLTDYCTWHMEREEKGMLITDYPRAAAHKADHYRIQEEFASALGPILRRELDANAFAKMFQSVFVDHIDTWDRDFSVFLQETGACLSMNWMDRP